MKVPYRWYLYLIFFLCWPVWVFSFSWPAPSLTPPLQTYAEFNRSTAAPGDVLQLTIRANIEPGWHLYSIHSNKEEGPQPTQVLYQNPWYVPHQELKESTPIETDDEALQLKVWVHQNELILTQQLRIKASTPPGPQDLAGVVQYQLCDNQICSPLQQAPFQALLTISEPTSTHK